ncbi:TlpA family protein disulfide reductase [Oscillochloris sp. ZM17-4]|uniref:peroxiredoxin family protein n=1 Tax=Oscillochloris sp. ZM17-4 TaxID=2866714 RepID=UPI001C739529|nr:TlpA disulfide reductase family protein [Oscillochloris sp. ZM17-4]MBX0329630.1 TlpA family protein disulfide reductase [Oscillochloris sp. ZM17-4]
MAWLFEDRRRWAAFSALLLLAGAAWTWAARVPPEAGALALTPSPRAGFPAPDFALDSLGGGQVRLSEQRGSVVLVNIWASWCGPCRAEMPAIQRLYAAESGRGLQILAVNSTVQDSADAARAFAEELGLSFPILIDGDGAVTTAYRVQALPSTFVIDRAGVVRRVLYGGPLSEATLRAELEPLLQEAP